MPIGPFVYGLLDTPAQFFIAHATARGTDLVTDLSNSPISPPTSPTVPNNNKWTTNHTPQLHQPSVTFIGTDTQHSTQSGNNNNTSDQEAVTYNLIPHSHVHKKENQRGKTARFSNASARASTASADQTRSNIVTNDHNSHIVPDFRSKSAAAIISKTVDTVQHAIKSKRAATAITPVPNAIIHCYPVPRNPKSWQTTANEDTEYNPALVNNNTMQNTASRHIPDTRAESDGLDVENQDTTFTPEVTAQNPAL